MKQTQTAIPMTLISEISAIEKVVTNGENKPLHADSLENMVKNFRKRWYRLTLNHFYERVIRELVDETYNILMDKVKTIRVQSASQLAIEDFNESPIEFPVNESNTVWNSLSNINSRLKALISR